MPSRALKLVADVSGQSIADLEKVADVYPFAIPPFLESRLKQGTYSLAALRQYMPDARELQDVAGFTADPTGEEGLHPVSMTSSSSWPGRLRVPTDVEPRASASVQGFCVHDAVVVL